MAVILMGLAAFPGTGRAQGQERRDQGLRNSPNPVEALLTAQNAGGLISMLVDANHDGQISGKEATDLAYRLIGNAFFRADTDGNGTVSQKELRAATESLLAQNPWLTTALEPFGIGQENSQAGNLPAVVQGIMPLLDLNGDQEIQPQEFRQWVQNFTQGYFNEADTNHDGQLNAGEVNAAVGSALRLMSQLAFQQFDANSDGQLSRAEYDKALSEPANVAFQVLDANHDGQVSQQEAQQAEDIIASRLQMGPRPESPSPAPSVRTPVQASPTTPAAVAPTANPPRTQPGQVRTQPGQVRTQPAPVRTQPAPRR